MRHGNFEVEEKRDVNWRVVSALWPYLMQFKGRLVIAMVFLVLSKLAILVIPFFLKAIVDALDTPDKDAIVATMLLGVVLAYGAARFSNVLFGEVRDTIFGRVTERAMRFLGMRVFRHLHALDLDYHLNRQTGGLARDIERGTTGISFLMRFFVFNILPTLFEIAVVVGILLVKYGPAYAIITFVSVRCMARSRSGRRSGGLASCARRTKPIQRAIPARSTA